jgi:hypothetical protein
VAAKYISQEIICTTGDDATNRQVCAGRVSNTAAEELDEGAISALINFFQKLDKWDLEAKSNGKAM